MANLVDSIAALPRVPLGHLPTPLQPLDRLSEELGGPRIWVKRDDCTGLAGGGNKTRKLEFLLGEAVKQGASCVVTFGAVQSNHARQTAAACAVVGLPCHLILSRRVPVPKTALATYEQSANVQLDRLFGATVHLTEVETNEATTEALLADLTQSGQRPYVMPAGGSSATGALGYAQAAVELQQQIAEHNVQAGEVVHASASGGTQAGLVWGLAHLGNPQTALGINVYHADSAGLEKRVRPIVERLSELHGQPRTTPQVQINSHYRGDGYGIPTQEAVNAIRLLARTEGLLFDPVYSGKALAGLIDRISVGEHADHPDIVFIHTGGAQALPAYQFAFE